MFCHCIAGLAIATMLRQSLRTDYLDEVDGVGGQQLDIGGCHVLWRGRPVHHLVQQGLEHKLVGFVDEGHLQRNHNGLHSARGWVLLLIGVLCL